jgi:hypothetical protein
MNLNPDCADGRFGAYSKRVGREALKEMNRAPIVGFVMPRRMKLCLKKLPRLGCPARKKKSAMMPGINTPAHWSTVLSEN